MLEAIKSSLAKGILDNVKAVKYKELKTVLPTACENSLDLLKELLQFNPDKRLTVDQALEHPYFKEFRSCDEEITCEEKINFDITEELKNEVLQFREECKKSNDLKNISSLYTRENTKKTN
jgi:mitogen-activated protein kinase 15